MNWHHASTFHLTSPFHGVFGGITSAMAGLYLIGFAAPAFEAAACHIGEMKNPIRDFTRAMRASASMAVLYFVAMPVIWLGALGPQPSLGLSLDRCSLRLDRGDIGGSGSLLNVLQIQLSDEIAGLRRVMSELRPPVLDQGGLGAAISDYTASFALDTGIECNVEIEDIGPLEPETETVLYRVMQEALTNVKKHSAASVLGLSLRRSGGDLLLDIRDNGRGLPLPLYTDRELLQRGHFGIAGIRERLTVAGGTLDLSSSLEEGTVLRARMPRQHPNGSVHAYDLTSQGAI